MKTKYELSTLLIHIQNQTSVKNA